MKAERQRPLVVLDTNIWISAALSREGCPAQLARAVLGLGQPVFSEATFAELQTRLWLPKFDRYISMELRHSILHDLRAAGQWIRVPEGIASQSFCRDASDDMFIHAALAPQAEWLVTGDHDLLAVKPLPGLRILTAQEALEQLFL
ncbi:putative toxin-antitoxin system toxin component, PIN family [Desulfonatronum zhilinae]|nr:putative toxin-antitoxin system toxin component, PIN family [Desulfonatronum zhilinae]